MSDETKGTLTKYTVEVKSTSNLTLKNVDETSQNSELQDALAFRGKNRKLLFNWSAFIRYYIVDVLASIVGPLLTMVIARAVFGKIGAVNMFYYPSSCKMSVILFLFGTIFTVITLFPLIESVLILAQMRPYSSFNPTSEGLIVFLTAIIEPIPSGVKYAYMPKDRFNDEVLANKKNAINSMMTNSESDSTVDAIGKWLAALSDKIMVNEVQNALWRSGDVMDGIRFKLNFVGKDSKKDQSPSKSSKLLGSKSQNEIQLKDLLIEVVRRNNGAKMWQFNKKYHKYIYPIAIASVAFVNPLYRYVILNVPPFGNHDWLEIVACIGAFIVIALNFMTGVLLRPLIASSGHLNRHRKILEDYQNLILPPLDDSDGDSLNESSESGFNLAVDSSNSTLPPIVLTPNAIKIWGRGREALLLYGQVYWKRLSLFTASLFGEVVILVSFLLVQLLLSILANQKLKLSAFMVIVSIIVLLFVMFFGLVVIEGMRLTYSRKIFRTKLLRRARHISLLNTEEAQDVAFELRKLANEIDSELSSHPVRLLGLKLNFTMMESLIGGLGVVMVGVYQMLTN